MHLSFPPGHVYMWLLVAGAVGIVVLLELIWWEQRRPRRGARQDDVFVSGSRLPHRVEVAGAAIVGFLLAGVVGVAVCAVLLLVPRRGARLPAIAGAAFALAGTAVFLSPGQFPTSGSGAFGAPAQLLAMVAVVAVVVSLVNPRSES